MYEDWKAKMGTSVVSSGPAAYLVLQKMEA